MKLSKNSFLDIFSHLTAKLPGFLKLYFSGRRRRKAVFYTAGTGKKPSSGFFSRPAVFLPPPEQKHGPAPRAVHGENFSFLPPFLSLCEKYFKQYVQKILTVTGASQPPLRSDPPPGRRRHSARVPAQPWTSWPACPVLRKGR